MRNRRNAFTLTEMLIVMGIVILFVVIAIPVVRTLTGNSSISMARNAVSALLVRAREEAVAMQDYRGVLFVMDKGSNRVVGLLVRPADLQDNTSTNGMVNILLLDTMPNRDSLSLPTGVGVHTIFNGASAANTNLGKGDRYMGFNVTGAEAGGVPQVVVGGCILFDGDGKVAVKPYGLQLASANGQVSGIYTMIGPFPPGLALTSSIVQTPLNSSVSQKEVISGPGSSFAWVPCVYANNGNIPTPPICTQLGLVLFDYDTFHSQGFTDQDADFAAPGTYQTAWTPGVGVDGDGVHSEQDEEIWLDSNSTPITVNRYDGSVIRGE